jgi:hypothetical protein
MFARLQRRTGRQIFISTHSPDILLDSGIGLDEVLVLRPSREGTTVSLASSIPSIFQLLDEGIPLPDIVLPETAPRQSEQLSLFAEA